MPDISKMLASIATCDDPERLRTWIDNALKQKHAQIADAAFRRLVSILPSEEKGTVEYDFWQTIHAFELVLTQERRKTTRLSRTRQKVGRVGIVRTLKDWAQNTKSTDGFDMLLARGMPELTGEAIVLRHPEKFDETVRAAARQRLVASGIDVDSLPT
jgi:hypothetical protein